MSSLEGFHCMWGSVLFRGFLSSGVSSLEGFHCMWGSVLFRGFLSSGVSSLEGFHCMWGSVLFRGFLSSGVSLLRGSNILSDLSAPPSPSYFPHLLASPSFLQRQTQTPQGQWVWWVSLWLAGDWSWGRG